MEATASASGIVRRCVCIQPGQCCCRLSCCAIVLPLLSVERISSPKGLDGFGISKSSIRWPVAGNPCSRLSLVATSRTSTSWGTDCDVERSLM